MTASLLPDDQLDALTVPVVARCPHWHAAIVEAALWWAAAENGAVSASREDAHWRKRGRTTSARDAARRARADLLAAATAALERGDA